MAPCDVAVASNFHQALEYGARQTPASAALGARHTTSPRCTLSAAVGLRKYVKTHFVVPRFFRSTESYDMAIILCSALGSGVTRSKRRAMQWCRTVADMPGMHNACVKLATDMYGDHPYAREVGHVAAAVGVTTSAGVMEGHDVPLDVMASVIHWLRKWGHDSTVSDNLHLLRRKAGRGRGWFRLA